MFPRSPDVSQYDGPYLFKANQGKFLFAAPPFFHKTYDVTPEQREQIIEYLGSTRRLEKFWVAAQFVFYFVIFFGLVLLVVDGFIRFSTFIIIVICLGPILQLAGMTWGGLVNYRVQPALEGLPISRERFTHTDWQRNRVAAMSKRSFISKIVDCAVGAAIGAAILIVFAFDPFEWHLIEEFGAVNSTIIVVAGSAEAAWNLWRSWRLIGMRLETARAAANPEIASA